uniref:Uncharacterized protein n=1 Tax=viral metagenome TaxID=1070528 RepID=A0A6M3LT92_9ZZZZ
MFRTEKQFRKYLSDVAKDYVADGFNLDGCAGDIADNLCYDPDIKSFVKKHYPGIATKTQWREFIADLLVV